MRLVLKLSPSWEPVPFNHLPVLAGALHKWLGPNAEHDGISLYSFSWLQGAQPVREGLLFPNGAKWFISALDGDFLQRSIKGILRSPEVRWGMEVTEVQVQNPPSFPEFGEVHFRTASPVFIKRRVADESKPDGENNKFYLFSDIESDMLLTETFQHKLRAAGYDDDGVAMRFDRDFGRARTKMVHYRGIENRASDCPVFVTGSATQLAFAWTVGVGNSTGIGFGSIY